MSNSVDIYFFSTILSFYRPISSKFFNFQVQKPHENVIVREASISNIVSQIVPFGGLTSIDYSQPKNHYMLNVNSIAPTCLITNASLHTFDGSTTSFKPDSCYTTAVVSRDDAITYRIDVRRNHEFEFEARLHHFEENFDIQIFKKSFYVRC